jgi:hypothetical protein
MTCYDCVIHDRKHTTLDITQTFHDCVTNTSESVLRNILTTLEITTAQTCDDCVIKNRKHTIIDITAQL